VAQVIICSRPHDFWT